MSRRQNLLAALLLWGLLLTPSLRSTLETSMTLHMLLQLPLLTLAGWLLGRAAPSALVQAFAGWDWQGLSGFLLTSITALVWMLPIALDAALEQPGIEAVKFLSIPLLIGLPLAWSWPRMGFVVRGVFVLEWVASAFRLAWLFLIAPDRLCSNYLLGDQQLLGKSLLVIGVLTSLWCFGWLLSGKPPAADPDAEKAAP